MISAYDKLPQISLEDARTLLAAHSFAHDDINHPTMETGFLGSLRPYRGRPNHEAFHEVMACLKAIGPSLSSADLVDRRVVSNVWGICHFARDWAIHPDGMLRRNGLISEADVETVECWINCISYATVILLESPDPAEAFAPYEEHMAGGC